MSACTHACNELKWVCVQEPCCFISASLDSRFSMWRRVAFPEVDTACALSGGPDSAAAEEGSLPSAFVCISQWDFRGLPVGCLAVSADGSLLAAGHGDLLSLWGSQGPSLIETLPLPALSAQAPAAEDSASEETQSYVRDVCCRSLHFIEAESGLLLVCAVSEYVLIYDLLDFAVVWKRDFVGESRAALRKGFLPRNNSCLRRFAQRRAFNALRPRSFVPSQGRWTWSSRTASGVFRWWRP